MRLRLTVIWWYIAAMSGSTRQYRFARLILKEISEIFQQDKRGLLGNTFITVADVQVSPDLAVARIYVSMMLAQDKPRILDRINSHKKEIRKVLGERIGKHVRIIPELIFYIDEVEENAMRLEELIKSLNIPPAGPDEME
jgi:ribosome-binding factor A